MTIETAAVSTAVSAVATVLRIELGVLFMF
jgi:hypothetical protein